MTEDYENEGKGFEGQLSIFNGSSPSTRARLDLHASLPRRPSSIFAPIQARSRTRRKHSLVSSHIYTQAHQIRPKRQHSLVLIRIPNRVKERLQSPLVRRTRQHLLSWYRLRRQRSSSLVMKKVLVLLLKILRRRRSGSVRQVGRIRRRSACRGRRLTSHRGGGRRREGSGCC